MFIFLTIPNISAIIFFNWQYFFRFSVNKGLETGLIDVKRMGAEE